MAFFHLRASTFLFVNLFRLLQLSFGDFEIFIFDRAEKARAITFVARRAGLLDLDEQHVAVAIERDVPDGLRVAALLALHPEFLARAAPEMRLAGGDGLFQRRAVHPRHHQHAAGFLFLNDRGDQAGGIKFQFVVETHVKEFNRQDARAQSGICPIHYGVCLRNGGGAAGKSAGLGAAGGTLVMTAALSGEKTGGLVSAGIPCVINGG